MTAASFGRVVPSLALAAATVASAAVTGCSSKGGDITLPPWGRVVIDKGIVSGTGTVRYYGFEGGFFAIRGDDDVTYDPLGGLPAELRQDGLRVRFVAKLRNDMGSIHMAGPIVELTSVKPE